MLLGFVLTACAEYFVCILLGNWKREHGQCLKDMHVQFSNLPVKYMFQCLQAFTIFVL